MRAFVLLAVLAILTAACTPTGTYVPSGGGGSGSNGGESLQESQERSGATNPGETGGATDGGGLGPISG